MGYYYFTTGIKLHLKVKNYRVLAHKIWELKRKFKFFWKFSGSLFSNILVILIEWACIVPRKRDSFLTITYLSLTIVMGIGGVLQNAFWKNSF